MSSIDNRIVNMQFNNREFEKNAGQTLNTLDGLKKSLQLEGVASGVENISSKFNIFGAIGFSVLNNLTNAAVDFGKTIAGAILDPLIEGGQKRALNIEQAKFQFQGLGMDVEQAMADSLYAVKDTAFGLDEAAVAASQFGASGVALGKDMQNALRGISGVAAMAGTSYSDMANVFTKVAGQGRLMGDDLNRLGGRGINAAATLAEAMGTTEEAVRDMVTKGQISFTMFSEAMSDAFGEHATKANETYTGSLSNMRAAISRIGASFATSKFEEQRRIFNALTPVIDGLAKALEPLMALFDEMSQNSAKNWENFLGGFATKNTEGVLEFHGILLDLVNAMKPLVNGVRNVIIFFNQFLNAIGKAFKKVFPASNGPVTVLTDLAKAFESVTKNLKFTKAATDTVVNVFSGLFLIIRTVLSVVWGIVQVGWTAITMFGSLLAAIGRLLAPIGKFVQSLFPVADGAESANDKIESFLDTIINFLNIVNNDFIGGLNKAAEAFDLWLNDGGPQRAVFDLMDGIIGLGQAIASLWNIIFKGSFSDNPFFDENSGIVKFLMKAHELLKPVGEAIAKFTTDVGGAIADLFRAIGDGIKYGFENINWGLVLGGLGVAIGGVLSYEAMRILGVWWTQFRDMFQTITRSIGFFGMLRGEVAATFTAFQQSIKAEALMKIAGALLMLAVALGLMSMIPPDRLLASMTAMGGGLVALMVSFEKIAAFDTKGFMKLPLITAALMTLGGAMLLIAGAVLLLGILPIDKVLVGTAALMTILYGLVGAAILMSKYVSGIAAASGSMILLATALNLLIVPIIALGLLPLPRLAQGMGAVTVMMAGLVGVAALFGNKKMEKNILRAAISLTVMGSALYLLIAPILALAFIPLANLAQGMGAVAVMLAVISGAAILLGLAKVQVLAGAAALLVMGAALNLLIVPILALAFIPFENLMQGLLGAALALGIVGGVAILLGLAGPALLIGALGVLAIGAAMWLLVPPVLALSLMDFGTIIGTLSGFGLALIIFSLAALLAAPGFLLISPILLIFGVALLGIAIAFAVFTAAILILTPALLLFGNALMEFAQQLPMIIAFAPHFAILGAALLIFGGGALIAGIGISALGIGLMIMGAGLWVLDKLGGSGTEALVAFGSAIAGMAIQAPLILVTSAALLVLGAAILVLGGGLLLVGTALLIFGAAMALIMLVAAPGALALGLLFAQLVKLIEYVPGLLVMTGIIIALGAAMLVLGAGLLILGAGALVAAGGLAVLQLVAHSGGMALMFLSMAALASAPAIPAILGLGAAFLVLGAGLVVFAAGSTLTSLALLLLNPGIMMMAVGVMMLSAGLKSLSVVGSSGAKALGVFVESLDGLFWQVASFLAIGGAFAVLGGGLILIGNGLLLVGTGATMAATGLAMVMVLSGQVDTTFAKMTASITGFMPALALISVIAIALSTLSNSLITIAKNSNESATGINKTRESLDSVQTSANKARVQLSGMMTSVTNQLPDFRQNLTSASRAYSDFVRKTKDLSNELEKGLKSSGTKSEAAAKELTEKLLAALLAGLVASKSSLRSQGFSIGDSIILGMSSGLQNRSSYLSNIARQVALKALQASKDALGVRSPSKEYEKIGEYADQGFANGLLKYSNVSERAAYEVGDSSLLALKKSIAGMANLVNDGIDTTPVIRPVLDLSSFKRDASLISSTMTPRSIDVDSSYNRAAEISAGNRTRAEEEARADEAAESDSRVTFIQNNNSPKALPPAEIYRKTKSQISTAKDKLVKK